MKIKELTIQAFELFAQNSQLSNYMQTKEYARFMGESKYNYDYIGLVDETNTIVAASLILWKKIGLNIKYGYAPKGFLINYYDEKLLSIFVKKLKEYYTKKRFVFIKINPEIVISEVDSSTYEFKDNPNAKLKNELQKFGFIKLKDNQYFESLNPRMNAYIDLKNSSFNQYSKSCRNKVRNAQRKGLYIERGTIDDLGYVYDFFDSKKGVRHFIEEFEAFDQSDMIDLILVKVDYERYIKDTQVEYEKEMNKNTLYNEIIHRSKKVSELNKKMDSDRRISIINADIIRATNGIQNSNHEIVAAALVIRYNNRVHIIRSGYSRAHSYLNANYFMFNAIINYYKKEFDFLDLNGISSDFKPTNPYKGLNRFKLGFSPKIYEYIGEFDLVFNKGSYDMLLSSGKLAQEFNKE